MVANDRAHDSLTARVARIPEPRRRQLVGKIKRMEPSATPDFRGFLVHWKVPNVGFVPRASAAVTSRMIPLARAQPRSSRRYPTGLAPSTLNSSECRAGGSWYDTRSVRLPVHVGRAVDNFCRVSALVIVLRQTLGGDLSRLDLLLTKIFVQLGFLVAGAALMPPLLALLQCPEPLVWRISSAIAAIAAALFALSYPKRRRAASGDSTPWIVWVDVGALLIAAALLTANAVALGIASGPGPYAVAITIVLYVSFLAYLQALSTIHQKHLLIIHRDEDRPRISIS